ncbi:hypothetical protein [Microbulbifer yueqingensis]|uniref:Phosphate-selective porin O and P n=1 Tax=Microbulbifer yueqingensis TaxID=658219 RepID=A0A1G9ANF6_9GAMM|nr:hypothetical protein [Microbulbifer yueqingensis]SDK28838.1 hypothetical protein SAMN05216212_2092 [Microbulbifer yueqingensis]
MEGRAYLSALLALTVTVPGWLLAQPGPTSPMDSQPGELQESEHESQEEPSPHEPRIDQLAVRDSASHPAPVAYPPAPSADLPTDIPGSWGPYEPGKGFVLARSDLGEVGFSIFSYVRYVNQTGLNEEWTDSFGRTFDVEILNQVQLQKVNLTFKGWLFDPRFRYRFYTWTSNSNQGQSAQVVVAGNLSYLFDEHFNLGGGIDGLPTTRSTSGTFPTWLRTDHRTIADEFFRGSYTTGIFAWGDITERSDYRVMVGNNLSQLGVSGDELDDHFNTMSGRVWWMPTTGEFGPQNGLGDYEFHTEPATLLGLHFTRSREDAQGQPSLNSFDNSQIRLSDGTRIFSPNPFDVGINIRRATYEMAAATAGLKYCGYSLEAEFFYREVDNFSTVPFPGAEEVGELPVSRLTDHGYQLQASMMVVPKTLQLYISGSKIHGEYGDPWDVAVGAKFYPFRRREVRFTVQGLFLEDSPVGYNSVPFALGGTGPVFNTEFEVAF